MSQGMKHGSETFFIEGEGVLTTQLGGRTGDEGDPLTESDTPLPTAEELGAELERFLAEQTRDDS